VFIGHSKTSQELGKKIRILQYLKKMCSLLKDVLFLITNGLDELLHPLQVDLANEWSGIFQSKREREMHPRHE